MREFFLRAPRLIWPLAICALAGCARFDAASHGIASAVTPYKVEVVQGNFISREQVEALQLGMSREQVRDVLGTPLLASLFHAERWDYVFTLKRQGVAPQQRRLAVFFKGDGLDRFEGDDMPSETEFVATLGARRKPGRMPELQASEDSLRKYPARVAEPVAPGPPSAPRTDYPPLEPAR